MKITIKTIGGAEFAITEIEQVNFEMDNGDEFAVLEGQEDSLWVEGIKERRAWGLSSLPTLKGILISLN
jgi:hypothetical protein